MKQINGKIIIISLGVISILFVFYMFYMRKDDFDMVTTLSLILISVIYFIGLLFSFFQQKIIDNEKFVGNSTIESSIINKIKTKTSLNYINYYCNLVDSYHVLYGKMLKKYFSVISSLSSILITLGLLGTVFGLIVSMGGLKQLVLSSGDNAGILNTMTKVLSGVDIAFYTTLFGSFLGGILLRFCLMVNEHNSNIVLNNVKMKWLGIAELTNIPEENNNKFKELEELTILLSSFSKLHFDLANQINNTNKALVKFEDSLFDISRIPIHNQLSILSSKMEDNTVYFRSIIDSIVKK